MANVPAKQKFMEEQMATFFTLQATGQYSSDQAILDELGIPRSTFRRWVVKQQGSPMEMVADLDEHTASYCRAILTESIGELGHRVKFHADELEVKELINIVKLMKMYAGQQIDTGDRAKEFLKEWLEED